jgi:hypothetical protein
MSSALSSVANEGAILQCFAIRADCLNGSLEMCRAAAIYRINASGNAGFAVNHEKVQAVVRR